MSALSAVRSTSDARSDASLVAATRAGDDDAFAVLYERYRARITGYARSMVGDHGRAEDVAQEVFISALRRMRDTERPIAFRPWIFEIARNACIDQFRRSRRAEEVSWDADEGAAAALGAVVEGSSAPHVAAETGERLAHLRGAFGELSPAHHEILVLRELEGRSYREIADRMGLTRPGVESTLFRARRRLTDEYDELSTGRRCSRIQAVITAASHGAVGARDRRRLARHLESCRGCRRSARLAGVDPGVLEGRGLGQKIAAILPFPALLRRLHIHVPSQLAVSATPALEPLGAGWAKATVAAVASLAVLGGSGGTAPAHHATAHTSALAAAVPARTTHRDHVRHARPAHRVTRAKHHAARTRAGTSRHATAAHRAASSARVAVPSGGAAAPDGVQTRSVTSVGTGKPRSAPSGQGAPPAHVGGGRMTGGYVVVLPPAVPAAAATVIETVTSAVPLVGATGAAVDGILAPARR